MHRALLIDDDISQLDLIEVLFQNNGFEVSQAASGTQALKLMDEIKNFSVIIVDLMMPVMSGDETIKGIRELDQDVPVIALTAVEDTVLHEKALSAGANLIITKPCRPFELLAEAVKLTQEAKNS